MAEQETASQEQPTPTFDEILRELEQRGILSKFVRKLEGQDDFSAVYANNVRLEWSAWDLKLFFGQLEQHTAKAEINWHTAVTIPWMQAKILEYYLRANIAFYEKTNGPLNVLPNLRPPQPERPSEDQVKADPKSIELWEMYKKLYTEVFGGA